MNNTTDSQESTENGICDSIATMWFMNWSVHISFLLALPLHTWIIFHLCRSVSKQRKYLFLIILQSVNEIVKVSSCVFYLQVCAVFHVFVNDYTTNTLEMIRLLLTVILMIYWKQMVRPQKLLDILMYFGAFLSMGIILLEIFEVRQTGADNPGTFILAIILCSIVAEIILALIGILTFFLVAKMDVSAFNEVTIKGQKKLAKVLFIQLIFVLITNAAEIYTSGVDYYILSGPYISEAKRKIAMETDMEKKMKIGEELRDHYKILLAVNPIIERSTALLERMTPIILGLLMYWVIKPLIQRKKSKTMPCPTITEFEKTIA